MLISAVIIKDIKTGSSLGFSDHTVIEFMTLMNVGLAKSGVRILTFKTVNFRFFKKLLNKIS